MVVHGKAPGHGAGKDQWLVQQPQNKAFKLFGDCFLTELSAQPICECCSNIIHTEKCPGLRAPTSLCTSGTVLPRDFPLGMTRQRQRAKA